MAGLLVGVLLGLGLFCIWWSFWPREQAMSPPHPRPGCACDSRTT